MYVLFGSALCKTQPDTRKIPECRPARMHIPAMRRGMAPGVLKTRRVTCSGIGSHSCQETPPKIAPARRVQFINSRTANSGIRHRIDSNFYQTTRFARSRSNQSASIFSAVLRQLPSPPTVSVGSATGCSNTSLKHILLSGTCPLKLEASIQPRQNYHLHHQRTERQQAHRGYASWISVSSEKFQGEKKRTKKRHHESFSSHGRSLPSHIHLHPAAEDANVEGVQLKSSSNPNILWEWFRYHCALFRLADVWRGV